MSSKTEEGNLVKDPVLQQTFKGHKDIVTALSFHPSIFMGHKAPIHDVCFSPNGNLIASASKDETVKLWNNSIEGNSVTIKAHNSAVRSVSFSCDGQLLLTSSDDKLVKVWSVIDRKFQFSLQGHTNWVRTSAFSPDVRLIASGSDDKTVKIWDTEKKVEVYTFTDHAGIITSVKFHPDGTCLASASHDRKIKIYDIRSKKLLQHYDAHSDAVMSISFHPTGSYLLSSSADAKLKLWDLKQGKLAYTLYGHDGSATATAFSAAGDYFATGGSDTMTMFWKSNFLDSQTEKYVQGGPTIAESDVRQSQQAQKESRYKTHYKQSQKVSVVKSTQQETTGKISSQKIQNQQQQSQQIQQQMHPQFEDEEQQNLRKTAKQMYYSEYDQSLHSKKEVVGQQKGIVEASDLLYDNNQDLNKQKYQTDQFLKQTNIQQEKYEIPAEITKTIDKVLNQIDFINKTLQVFQMRISNNEEQISNLNSVLTREFEKIQNLQENLYGMGVMKKEGQIFSSQDQYVQDSRKQYGVQFYRAANN